MNLVVFGGRDFNNYELLKTTIESTKAFREGKITHVVCGMAQGADLLGKRWAEEQGLEVIKRPADWDRYGKAAGAIRNREMAEISDGGIGFWDGKSTGTNNMINNLKKLHIPYVTVQYTIE